MSEGLNRESFTEAIEGLDIPEGYKSKIRDCLENLFIRNQKLLENLKLKGADTSNIHSVLQFVLKMFTTLIDNVLPVPIVGGVVTSVAKFFALCCGNLQISHAVSVLLSKEKFSDCRKAVSKLEMSILYCTGVFQDLANATTDTERDAILRPVPSDVPVLIAADELSVLQGEIQDLTRQADVGKFDELMSKAELYCSIATLRELVLSLRMVIQSLHGGCTTGILEVLKKQWKDAEELLSFLYKPSLENLKLHLEYLNNMNWPVVVSFLETRHLHTDDMSYLDGKAFSIVFANDPSIRIYLCAGLLFFTMIGNTSTDKRTTAFTFKHCGNNIFTIRWGKYLEYHISSRSCTRAHRGEPNHPRGKWRVVKIDYNNNDESDIFVFVPTSSRYHCMYIDSDRRVYDKAFDPSDKRCFWKLRRTDTFKEDFRSEWLVNSFFELFVWSFPIGVTLFILKILILTVKSSFLSGIK